MTGDFDIGYLKENGFRRQRCGVCGSYFWSLGEHDVCGEAPCTEYDFISKRTFKASLDLHQMRKRYLTFFETRGHTIVGRYPIVARWRDDTFFTNATIYAFQPWVTSGVVEPPANPLVMSQTVVRFNDVDNVGVTGRHLTMFEMMAHHAFNKKDKEIYFKDRTVELCHELLTQDLGTEPDIIKYKEEWWEGGGNSGPSLSVGVRGIELATLVFMQYSGTERRPMDIRVVDTGYGLERFAWVSQCAPNAYEAAFPDVVEKVRSRTGVVRPDADILRTYSRVAGMMDLESKTDIRELKTRAAKKVDMEVDALDAILVPLERVYSITDHVRASAFLISDGVLPSNVKAGYFLRLLIRRALRCIEALGSDLSLVEVARWHIASLSPHFPELDQSSDEIIKIIEMETLKYAETVKRGSQIVSGFMKEKGKIELEDLITLYDSHGLTPETVQRIAKTEIKVPDDFFTKVAALHETVEKDQVRAIPRSNSETELLCYDLMSEVRDREAASFQFDANVVEILPLTPEKKSRIDAKQSDAWVVLDRTYFYPEGGGQESDRGTITIEVGHGKMSFPVIDVQRSGKGILHWVQGDGVGGLLAHHEGSRIAAKCSIDLERRLSLMRHHTATHVVNSAAKGVLGRHVWQAGAHKFAEGARLDITHYEAIDDETLKKIEKRANEIVMQDIKIEKAVEDRTKAELEHGFTIYQGGFVPGKELRIVDIPGFDVEACGGTHCDRTGEIGLIRILGAKRIQDGIVRIEFVAGERALERIDGQERMIKDIASLIDAPEGSLVTIIKTLLEDRRRLEKRLSEASKHKAEGVLAKMLKQSSTSGGIKVIFSSNEYEPEVIEEVSRDVSSIDGAISILNPKGVGKLYITRGKGVKLSAKEVLRKVCEVAGGGGGGTDEFARGEVRDPSKLKEGVEKALHVELN